MAPNYKSDILETGSKVALKFKEILLSNGVNDEIESLTMESGMQPEGFGSVAKYLTVTFKNSDKKPLNLFLKTHTTSAAHSELLNEAKIFEKEAMFFMDYVPVAKEFCKSKGYTTIKISMENQCKNHFVTFSFL